MRLLSVLLFLLFPVLASAQGYPNRAVRIIVPFAPGGASDFVARIMQPRLGELLGQTIVVENRPGASGNIGVDAAAKAAPDGYTVFLGNVGSIAINPSVYPSLPVNPLRDLIAVSQVVDVPSMLIAHPSAPFNSVKELVAYAKANPGKLNYASPGSGSLDRLEMEVLRRLENLEMVHVPYKGGAGPAVAGLMGGETHLMFATAASAMPAVRGGKAKAIGVTGTTRLEQVPNAGTMVEQGYPDLTASSWQGFFVPVGTPKEIIEKLHGAAVQTMKTPDVVSRLATGGAFPLTSASPSAFADYVATETKRWARIAKESNATAD
jgi:tripartite-type tricarboxylate transporter receptor subunit TctC